jgi:hypothetical protein
LSGYWVNDDGCVKNQDLQVNHGVYMRWDVVRAPSGIDTSKLLYDIYLGGGTPNIKFNFGAPSQDEYQGKYTFKLIVRDLVTGCQSTDTVDVKCNC